MLPAVRALVSYGALLALVVASQSSRADAGLETTRQSIRRHFTPADRERGRYQHVPFDVPRNVTEMTIAYRYDTAAGASVVVWNGDTIASKPVGAATFALPTGSGYARVHVVAADGSTIAITNPVYVKRSS